MTPTPGTRDLGPVLCDLLLSTTCEGALARMGHDLTLVVEDCRGTLVLGDAPADCSLRVTADLRSLRVREGHGGAKPLTAKDSGSILDHARAALDVDRHPELTFTSTAIDGSWEAGRVEGQLTVHGRTEVQDFAVVQDDDAYVLTGQITQTRFGIKPFSTMMGALRVGDAVDIVARVRLD